MEDKHDLTELFFRVIECLVAARAKIQRDNEKNSSSSSSLFSQNFGQRRDGPKCSADATMVTPICVNPGGLKLYSPLQEELLQTVKYCLSNCKAPWNPQEAYKSAFIDPADDSLSYTVEITNPSSPGVPLGRMFSELQNAGMINDFMRPLIQYFIDQERIRPLTNLEMQACTLLTQAALMGPDKAHQLQTKSPEFYLCLVKAQQMQGLFRFSLLPAEPPPRTFVAIIVRRMVMEDKAGTPKRFPVSTLLVPFQQESGKAPNLEGKMTRKGGVTVHQDLRFIEQTMKHMAKLFAEAMSAPDLKTLKNRVAVLRWTWANCSPHPRGDGAVGDMLELAIYIAKGYKPNFYKNVITSGLPLVLNLPQFLEKYDSIIEVEEKSESNGSEKSEQRKQEAA